MKLVYKISSLLLVVTGLLYLFLTPVFFSHFGRNVLWSAGTGLGFVFLGNLNLIVLLCEKLNFYITVLTSNALGLMITIIILTVLNSIQAYVSAGVMTLVMAGSVMQYIKLMNSIVKKNYTLRH